MDKLSKTERSRNMSRIRSTGTSPELQVRRFVFRHGFRYRLHGRSLPGKPDLVFPGRKKVIFVHGCFWHQHPGCREGRIPSSNQAYWEPKLNRNTARDLARRQELERSGWSCLVVWECELKQPETAGRKILAFLRDEPEPVPRQIVAEEQQPYVSE